MIPTPTNCRACYAGWRLAATFEVSPRISNEAYRSRPPFAKDGVNSILFVANPYAYCEVSL